MGLLDESTWTNKRDVTEKAVNWTQNWGHIRKDWGSSMQFNGYFLNLGVGMALATNSLQPMNFTVGAKSIDK